MNTDTHMHIHGCTWTWAHAHMFVHIYRHVHCTHTRTYVGTGIQKYVEKYMHTNADAWVYPLDTHLSQTHGYTLRTPCTATRGPLQTRPPAHAPGAHSQVHTHACPRPPAPLLGTVARQSPRPHPFISLWTVASGLDQGQGVGAGHAEAAAGDGIRRGRGGRMTLDAWGRRALQGAALPPPWHEELINLMN